MDLAKPLTLPLNTVPVIRLTEEVLRQHTLEEMRRNGIPSKDFLKDHAQSEIQLLPGKRLDVRPMAR